MKVKLQWKWFDLWVGFYWDQKNTTLYFLPFPTVVFKFEFGKPTPSESYFTNGYYKDFVVHCPTFEEGITETKTIKVECFKDQDGTELLSEHAHEIIEGVALRMQVAFLYREIKRLKSMLAAEPALRIDYEKSTPTKE